MASCASDAPEAPNTSAETTGDGVYVTFNIGDKLTRALGDAGDEDPGNATETKINDVTVYLFSSTGQYIFSGQVKTATTGEQYFEETQSEDKTYYTGGKAHFKVNAGTFTSLKQYAGQTVNFYVVCNSDENASADITTSIRTESDLINKTVTKAVSMPTPANAKPGSYIMTSHYTATLNTFVNEENAETVYGSKENPWDAFTQVGAAGNTDITVERIASKFTYAFDDEEGVADQGLTFTFQGATPVNENQTVYLFKHFANTGSSSDFASTTNWTDLKLISASGYSKLTSVRPNPETFTDATLGSHTYSYKNGNSHLYMPMTCVDNKTAYNRITYMAFDYTLTAVDEAKNKDLYDAFTAHNTLYSYNGILLGDKDMMANYTNPDYVPSDKVNASEIISMYNAAKAKDEADIDQALYDLYKDAGLRQFKYENGAYHVYYFHGILCNAYNSQKPTQVCHWDFFGVYRNEIYEIGVNSIKAMGYPGYWIPGQVVEESVDTYFDMNLTIKNWTKRDNKFDLE